MSFETWLLFTTSTFFLSATPGANMLLAFQFGLNHGFRKTLYALAGLSLGLLILLTSSLLFVGWLSQTAPFVFELMKIVAALYLTYLGWQFWRQSATSINQNTLDSAPTRCALFRTGMAVSLSNPKAILFFSALFPKFLNPNAPLLSQYWILTISFFMIETFWQLIYTSSGKALASWLNNGQRLRYLNRLCSLIFIFLATGLLWDMLSHR